LRAPPFSHARRIGTRQRPGSRIQAQGTELVAGEDHVPESNGLALLPEYDYKKLYVISTGKGPGDHWPPGRARCTRSIGSNNKVSNQKLLSHFMIDGLKSPFEATVLSERRSILAAPADSCA